MRIRLRTNISAKTFTSTHVDKATPEVNEAAIKGLKFAEILPPDLAAHTVGQRMTDRDSAETVIAEARQWSSTT